MHISRQKLTSLFVLLPFVVSLLIVPRSAYAFSVSPSVTLECSSENTVFVQLYITNNEQSDTLVATVQSSIFNYPWEELEGGTVNPGQTQLVGVQTNNKSVTSGTITLRYYKQNNPSTLESQNVGFGSISCPLPTSTPIPTPTVLPTNIPTPTVSPSSNTHSQTNPTSTPVPTQKPTNSSDNNKQNKPSFEYTNSNKSDEKEQKNNEDTYNHSTSSAHPALISKINKSKNNGVFMTIRNFFGGLFNFLNPFKNFHSNS